MRRCLSLALLLALPIAIARVGPDRVALVIGNGGYRHLRPLENPAGDARAVAGRLAELGFVSIGSDGNPVPGHLSDLDAAAFGRTVRASRIPNDLPQ